MFSESRPDLTQRSITTHQEYPCHVQTYDSYGSEPTNTTHNSSIQNINKSSTLFLDLQKDPFYDNKPSWKEITNFINEDLCDTLHIRKQLKDVQLHPTKMLLLITFSETQYKNFISCRIKSGNGILWKAYNIKIKEYNGEYATQSMDVIGVNPNYEENSMKEVFRNLKIGEITSITRNTLDPIKLPNVTNGIWTIKIELYNPLRPNPTYIFNKEINELWAIEFKSEIPISWMHSCTTKNLRNSDIHNNIIPDSQNRNFHEDINRKKETIKENEDYNVNDLDVNSLHFGEVIQTIKGQNIKTTLTKNKSINVIVRTDIIEETITQGEQVILTFNKICSESEYTANKIIPLRKWNNKKHHFTGTIVHKNKEYIVIQFIKDLQIQYAIMKKYSLIKHQRNITVKEGETIKFITKPKHHPHKAIFGFIYETTYHNLSKTFESEAEEISKIEQFILQSKMESHDSPTNLHPNTYIQALTKEQELDLIFGPNAAIIKTENLETQNIDEGMNEN